jgi:hypothetical protein
MGNVSDVSKVHAAFVITVEVLKLGSCCDYIAFSFEEQRGKGLEWGLVPRLGTPHSVPSSPVPFQNRTVCPDDGPVSTEPPFPVPFQNTTLTTRTEASLVILILLFLLLLLLLLELYAYSLQHCLLSLL